MPLILAESPICKPSFDAELPPFPTPEGVSTFSRSTSADFKSDQVDRSKIYIIKYFPINIWKFAVFRLI